MIDFRENSRKTVFPIPVRKGENTMENFESGEVSEVSGGEGQVYNQPSPEAQEQDAQELPPPSEGEEEAEKADDPEDETAPDDLSEQELTQPDPTAEEVQDPNMQAINEGETIPEAQPEKPETGEHAHTNVLCNRCVNDFIPTTQI